MGEKLAKDLRSARQRAGLTQSRVAAELGVTRAAVGQWENGSTSPTADKLMQLAVLLKFDEAFPAAFNRENIEEPSKNKENPKDYVGVISTAAVSDKDDSLHFVLFPNSFEDLVRRPAGAAHKKDVYAIHIDTEKLVPRFYEGELVFLEHRRPLIYDYVLVEMRSDVAEPDGERLAFIGRLVERKPDEIVIQQHNPSKTIKIANCQISRVDRVIPWNELLQTR